MDVMVNVVVIYCSTVMCCDRFRVRGLRPVGTAMPHGGLQSENTWALETNHGFDGCASREAQS